MFKPYRKTNSVLKMTDSILELSCPKNISSLWSFGSLLSLCLITQVMTGLFLTMSYDPNMLTAFDSTIYINRDVNNGWLIRSIHANSASFFFICLYIHTGRGIYYKSYLLKNTWMIGITLLILTIITAFLGYVLPWGQMSYWAATVITNLISAMPYCGDMVVKWLWGNFSVSNATLMRFYTFHFLMPFVIMALSMAHIVFLHETGSSNPLGLMSKKDIMNFHPYFTVKDLIGFCVMWTMLGSIVLFSPNLLTDPENFIPANPLVTPTHIQPEWYFLPMYAILRSIPNKLGGIIALLSSIMILYLMPFLFTPKKQTSTFTIKSKWLTWNIYVSFLVLMWIGSKPVEPPFEKIGQMMTTWYFSLYLIMQPLNKNQL
nr:cytochrome b [Cupuladria biporosa]